MTSEKAKAAYCRFLMQSPWDTAQHGVGDDTIIEGMDEQTSWHSLPQFTR